MDPANPVRTRSSQYWDVKSPPVKEHVIAGKLVPTVRGAIGIHRRKRLVIDIVGTAQTSEKVLHDDDRVVITILNPKKTRRFSGFLRKKDDDSDDSEDEEDSKDSMYEGWVEYRKYGLDEIEEASTPNEKTWEALLGRTSTRELREFNFASAAEMKQFTAAIAEFKRQNEEKAKANLEAFRQQQTKTIEVPDGKLLDELQGKDASRNLRHAAASTAERLDILVEIVSATDLPIADRKSSDPYTICYLGKDEIHRTLPLATTLNPVWTVENGSLFLLQTTATELFGTSGLVFIVKDYDSVTKNDPLARVTVSPQKLLEYASKQPSERLQFALDLLGHYKKASNVFHPSLYLRFRHASTEDIKFLIGIQEVKSGKRSSKGIYAEQIFIGPRPHRVKLVKRESKVKDGKKLYRVKPGPDPKRPDDTKWMSQETLDDDNKKPSSHWIEAGSGRLGKIFVEVLHCKGLPDMDTGVLGKGKTDAFCSIIYEDCMVSTDVINDELNPRWPSWSQRAFCLRMNHASSQILIGVLDYDSDRRVNSHDAIGRISVDVTNMRPHTDYTLVYNLYKSVLDNVRDKRGTVTVRLRIDYKSFSEVMIGSLQPPPLNYINVSKRADFKTSYFVCHGEENLEKLDMEAIHSYKAELEGYICVLQHVKEAFLTVFLWRGHYRVHGTSIKLPIHSLVAYILAARLVENLNKLPSFFFFAIAWLLLATNEQRFVNPNPWCQPMSFGYMWTSLLYGDKPAPVQISDHENEAAIRRYELAVNKQTEKDLRAAERAKQRAEELTSLTQAEESVDDAEEETMETTKMGGISLHPLSPILLPIQHVLGTIAKILRILSSIILWNESILAFALVNSCFALGLLFLFVPWHFFIRWTLRVAVHLFMGPWMKLVDVYYLQELNSDDPNNYARQLEAIMQEKLKSVNVAKQTLMMSREEVKKTEALKKLMFGRFVTKIPQWKEYRYPDIPKPASIAHPSKTLPAEISERQYGQSLEGCMIPRWGDAVDSPAEAAAGMKEATEVPTAKETEAEDPELVGDAGATAEDAS